MRPPDRAALVQIIRLPCMVRRDRTGQALFISDYPRRAPGGEAERIAEALTEAGYIVRLVQGLAHIDWQPARYFAYYQALPPPRPGRHDIARLLAEHSAALEKQDLELLSQALRLKLLGDLPRLIRLLETGLADALREHRAPPHHAARLF